jgi:hypothetical protein
MFNEDEEGEDLLWKTFLVQVMIKTDRFTYIVILITHELNEIGHAMY